MEISEDSSGNSLTFKTKMKNQIIAAGPPPTTTVPRSPDTSTGTHDNLVDEALQEITKLTNGINTNLTSDESTVSINTALDNYPGTNVKHLLNSTDQKFRNFTSSNSVRVDAVGNNLFSFTKSRRYIF